MSFLYLSGWWRWHISNSIFVFRFMIFEPKVPVHLVLKENLFRDRAQRGTATAPARIYIWISKIPILWPDAVILDSDRIFAVTLDKKKNSCFSTGGTGGSQGTEACLFRSLEYFLSDLE